MAASENFLAPKSLFPSALRASASDIVGNEVVVVELKGFVRTNYNVINDHSRGKTQRSELEHNFNFVVPRVVYTYSSLLPISGAVTLNPEAKSF